MTGLDDVPLGALFTRFSADDPAEPGRVARVLNGVPTCGAVREWWAEHATDGPSPARGVVACAERPAEWPADPKGAAYRRPLTA